MQVAFYAILLKALIATEGIADLDIHHRGAIWLKGKSKPDYCALAPIVSLVEEFIYRRLDQPGHSSPLEELLRVPRREARWQMTPVCLSPSPCKYFALCHHQTLTEKRLGGIAYISKATHNLLLAIRDKFIPPEERISDIEDLFKVVKKVEGEESVEDGEGGDVPGGARKVLFLPTPVEAETKEPREEEANRTETLADTTSAQQGSQPTEPIQVEKPAVAPVGRESARDLLLSNMVHSVGPRIVANHQGTVQKCESVSLHLPKSEEIAIFVTVYNDPISNQLFAWGILVIDRSATPQQLPPQRDSTTVPPSDEGKKVSYHSGSGELRFARELSTILGAIHSVCSLISHKEATPNTLPLSISTTWVNRRRPRVCNATCGIPSRNSCCFKS